MKTQINTLQRGHGNKGIIGTSFEIRREVAQAVKAENPNTMRVVVNGIEMELTYAESTTGKSFWYESKALPVDIVKLIVPGDAKAINHPELVSYHFRINGDMTCEYVCSRRCSEQARWKPGQLIEVAEANVTII